MNKPVLMSAVLGLAFLLAAPVAARDSGVSPSVAREMAATAGNPARLVVNMSVTRQGAEATYSITLSNTSDTDVKDVFLAGGIPAGASFIAPGPNPAKSGFRAVEDNNAAWLSEVVPARSQTGPFTYRVRLAGDTAEAVHAWAHWRAPADGAVPSPDIRVLPLVTAGVLASGTVDSLPQGPLMWQGIDVLRGAQSSRRGAVQGTPRLIYITEGTARTFGQNGVIGTYGPGSAHFLRPGVAFDDDAVRSDAHVRWLVFNATAARTRGGPPPNPEASFIFESDDLTGLTDGPHTITLSLVEAHPGGSTATHYHPGPTLIYVLEGTVIHNLESGSTVYGRGSFFVEQAGELNSQVYPGPGVTRLLAARLVPQGQPASVFPTEARPHPWTLR